ncbi:IS110 family transposase, partial [Salmonella enterica]
MVDKVTEAAVVGGVDTHKDLHVAAVVDQNNKVLGTQYFSTTRQGYRQMLAWMTSFGTLKRIGVECTGTYGSGLLRYFQNAGLEVLEVTAPDRMERRKRGKSDTIDAECAAHAAFSGIRTVTPKTRDGMIEGTVAKLAMRQPFVLFKGLTFQKLCLPGAFRPGDHHNKMLRPGLCVVHAS